MNTKNGQSSGREIVAHLPGFLQSPAETFSIRISAETEAPLIMPGTGRVNGPGAGDILIAAQSAV
jgi:hypothetical protein